jgi:peptide/nickel transport system substrate-binding protein
VDDPNYVLSLTLQCEVFGNYTDYCNERVDEIIETGWTELDKEKRFKMFQEAQQIIVDEAPWVFLAQPDFHLAARENVHGYVHHLNEIVRYYDFYKE